MKKRIAVVKIGFIFIFGGIKLLFCAFFDNKNEIDNDLNEIRSLISTVKLNKTYKNYATANKAR